MNNILSLTCAFDLTLPKFLMNLTNIMNRQVNNVLILWLSAVSFSFSFRSMGRFPVPSVLYSDVSEADHSSQLATESYRAPLNEIDRRRNFAIISHPDAGRFKTCEIIILVHPLKSI